MPVIDLPPAPPTPAASDRCPACHGEMAVVTIDVPVGQLLDPPRQVERFVRFVKWQCLRVEEHRGEYQVAVDDAS